MLLGYNVQSTNDWHNQNLHKLVNINRIYSEKNEDFVDNAQLHLFKRSFLKFIGYQRNNY